jgi:hypothetical protein
MVERCASSSTQSRKACSDTLPLHAVCAVQEGLMCMAGLDDSVVLAWLLLPTAARRAAIKCRGLNYMALQF